MKDHDDKRLFNIDEFGIKFRKFRARLLTHEYSISVITLLPQRVIHFGAVSNNFTTFCINKTVAGRSRRFMVHFCRVLRMEASDGLILSLSLSLFPSLFSFSTEIKYAKYIFSYCNERLIDMRSANILHSSSAVSPLPSRLVGICHVAS